VPKFIKWQSPQARTGAPICGSCARSRAITAVEVERRFRHALVTDRQELGNAADVGFCQNRDWVTIRCGWAIGMVFARHARPQRPAGIAAFRP
jgi:hypothetical protein